MGAWIDEHADDRYATVREASVRHREEHGPGCTVYPTSSGPLLGVLAATAAAWRILELGTGLGYSALWLAHNGAHVDTIEQDATHAELARTYIEGADIQIHVGTGAEVLPTLERGYDLIFNDGEPIEFETDLDQFERLLRPFGLLVSANLFLGQYSADVEGLEHAAAYRARLLDPDRYLTTILRDGLALSVLR